MKENHPVIIILMETNFHMEEELKPEDHLMVDHPSPNHLHMPLPLLIPQPSQELLSVTQHPTIRHSNADKPRKYLIFSDV